MYYGLEFDNIYFAAGVGTSIGAGARVEQQQTHHSSEIIRPKSYLSSTNYNIGHSGHSGHSSLPGHFPDINNNGQQQYRSRETEHIEQNIRNREPKHIEQAIRSREPKQIEHFTTRAVARVSVAPTPTPPSKNILKYRVS